MKKLLVSALVTVALSSAVWAQPTGSPVDRYGSLKVVGNKIVSSKTNMPVALRGMSFFWNNTTWGSIGEPYYTTGVVNTLADDWKVDVVRVAIDPGNTGAQNWKTVVAAAKTKGIYVIVDFHAHNKDRQSAAVEFFRGLSNSADYKNVPNIIYEVFNEPCPTGKGPPVGDAERCNGDDWVQHVKPYAEAVVGAIRGNNDTNIVIIGTPNFSKRVDLAAANRVTAGSGKNLVYALHYYTGHVSTTDDPIGTNSEHRQRLRDWADVALTHPSGGVAIIVSEFGISQPGGGRAAGENNSVDTEEAQRWFDFLNERQIGWLNWSICNKDEAASALQASASTNGSWSANDLRVSGTYIREKLRYYGTPVTFSATAGGAGQGSVSVSPQSPYYPWQQVTLTASVQSGSRFEGWSGDYTGNATETVKTMLLPGNANIQAVFFPVNPISNSTFTAGANGWLRSPSSGTSAPNIEAVNGELVVAIPNAGAIGNRLVYHGNTSLTNGRRYKLTFDAKATAVRTIQAAYFTSDAFGEIAIKANIGGVVSLTTTKTGYQAEFNMTDPTTTAGMIGFGVGGSTAGVTFDNVRLEDIGAATSIVQHTAVAAKRTAWTLSRNGGALQLRGPTEAGATVSLYDVRGKAVRSMAAVDGLTLGAGIPAGSYVVIVKNRAGGEVLRTKAVMTK